MYLINEWEISCQNKYESQNFGLGIRVPDYTVYICVIVASCKKKLLMCPRLSRLAVKNHLHFHEKKSSESHGTWREWENIILYEFIYASFQMKKMNAIDGLLFKNVKWN